MLVVINCCFHWLLLLLHKRSEYWNRTCYHFDGIIKIEDFAFVNISIDEKSFENILVYDISYKNLIGAKLLHIRFNKIDGFIRVYNGTRYLVLCSPEKYDFVCNSIIYKWYNMSFSHNYAKIRIDLYDSLHLEKWFTLHNVIILIKSVLNKNQNHYNYNIFVLRRLVSISWKIMVINTIHKLILLF